LDHLVIASPRTCPWGRETLREKPRESSGPGSGKSGDRLPEGVGVSSHANEGRRCETSVLKFGSFSPAVFNFRCKGEICISEIFEHKRAWRTRVVCSRKSSEHMSTQYAPPFICVESRRRCVSGPLRNAGQYVQSVSTGD
jgi:hypothetical protein